MICIVCSAPKATQKRWLLTQITLITMCTQHNVQRTQGILCLKRKHQLIDAHSLCSEATRHIFLLVTVKEWLKSVLNYRSYPENKTGYPVFGPPCICVKSYGRGAAETNWNIGVLPFYQSTSQTERRLNPIGVAKVRAIPGIPVKGNSRTGIPGNPAVEFLGIFDFQLFLIFGGYNLTN